MSYEIHPNKYSMSRSFVSVGIYLICMSLCAQLKISLFFSPVPISLLSFCYLLFIFIYPPNVSLMGIISYVGLGLLGAPIMAGFQSLDLFGPTSGYLCGMIASTYFLPKIVKKSHITQFKKALLIYLTHTFLVFSFGLLFLSFHIPTESVFTKGYFPFLPGDLLKSSLAIYLGFKFLKKEKFY